MIRSTFLEASGAIFSLLLATGLSRASNSGLYINWPENQSLIINNISTNSALLFSAYMSDNIEERQLAESYVLGVLDATEGILWCGYDVISASEINEQVYESLKNHSETDPSGRAANAVISNLVKFLPCDH